MAASAACGDVGQRNGHYFAKLAVPDALERKLCDSSRRREPALPRQRLIATVSVRLGQGLLSHEPWMNEPSANFLEGSKCICPAECFLTRLAIPAEILANVHRLVFLKPVEYWNE
jgi:hypothetical protein